MELIFPNYYNLFKCIANHCRHNCCIGWEIDIDNDTLSKYHDTYFLEKISKTGGAHFILDDKSRCPFLNENNLCDIILRYGEDMLCQICNDHPRYRNFYSNRVEVGLGLCCEAACELILKYENKMILLNETSDFRTYDETEIFFFKLRDKIFDILQNRNINMDKRIENMLKLFDLQFSFKDLKKKYIYLERLDNRWDDYLNRVENITHDINLPDKWQIPFEQIAVYFIYRHLSFSIEDGLYEKWVYFAAQSYYMIKLIFLKGNIQTISELIEISRLYSSEIEYSDQNITTLLNME